MSDTIYRQDAIDVVDKYDFEFPQYMEKFVTELRDAMKADLKCDIANLPSAEGCKCHCEYREPCDYCHYDGHRGHGCPAEEGLKDE